LLRLTSFISRSVAVIATFAAFCAFLSGATAAQENPYAPGWDIDPATSFIHFESIKFVKGEKIVETHSFAAFTGEIGADGKVALHVKLDSVDTKNDLRNVRMRFLFFETFKFPTAEVTAQLAPDMAAGLTVGGEKRVSIPVRLSLHGVENGLSADTTIRVTGPDSFEAVSAGPILFKVEDFNLGDSLKKIAETAGGFDIVPAMTISFQLGFVRRGAGQPAPSTDETAPPAMAALETKGDFSAEECVGRFQILSETGNIYFASGSAQLDAESTYVLATVLDVISRCPGMRVMISGHTDDVGSNELNQRLSERRAQSVVDYLARKGVDRGRLISAGFGEERPMVANDSDFHKSRNRRIEFSLFR
jgi:OmpA-OmpF porin, OOP family